MIGLDGRLKTGQQVTTRRVIMNIYVENLSYQVAAENVRQTFETFGQGASATLSKDKYSGQPKGLGL
jgi:RNA recognition motif-containing protein